MLAHRLRKITSLIPEALPLVKSASVHEDFPLSTKADCLASALRVEYAKFIEPEFIDDMLLQKVACAITIHSLGGEVKDLSDKMRTGSLVKSASAATPASVIDQIEMKLSGTSPDVQGIVKLAEAAVSDPNRAQSDLTDRYSANMYLEKSAAISALNLRFSATNNTSFVKIAQALSKEPDLMGPSKNLSSLCRVVTSMDKQAGLIDRGFNFYQEVLLTKQAAYAIRVKLGREEFPIETILKIPTQNISGYLGADVAAEFKSGDPATIKAVVESLPMDSKQTLLRVIKASKLA